MVNISGCAVFARALFWAEAIEQNSSSTCETEPKKLSVKSDTRGGDSKEIDDKERNHLLSIQQISSLSDINALSRWPELHPNFPI